MKSQVLGVLVAALTVAPASVLASDMALGDGSIPHAPICAIGDTPGLHTVNVFHRFSLGNIASRFKVASDPGMTMTYVSETHPYSNSLGNTQDGLSVCYDECVTGSTVVAVITYMGYGTSTSPCSFIRVVPHPEAETLDAMTCGYEPEIVSATHLEVRRGSGSCNYCISHMDRFYYPGTAEFFNCEALTVKSSTWGAIKALYLD